VVKRYTDRHGQEHRVEVTLLTRRRILEQMEIDLVRCAHDYDALTAMLNELSQDDVVWQMLAIIEGKQVDELLEAADGTTHEAASAALLGAIVDFFPAGSPLRSPLTRLLAKVGAAQLTACETSQQMLMEIVDGLDFRSADITAAAPMSG